MKRKISSFVMATAVLTGSVITPVAVTNVSAASIQQQNTQKDTIIVNGQEKVISFTELNKKKLYSIDQLSQIMAATVKYNSKTKIYEVSKKSGKQVKKIDYKENSADVVVNGKNTKLNMSTKMVGKTLFVEADSFVKALGGDLLVDKNLLITVEGTFNFTDRLLTVDGNAKNVKALNVGGKQLYSVQDIAKLFSASTTLNKNEVLVTTKDKTIKLKLSTKSMVVNNKSVSLKENPVLVKNVVYAELSDLISALGGDLVKQQNGFFVATTGLVNGDTFNPQWIDNGTILVANETETGSRSLLVNVASKKETFTVNASELAVSPNGKQAIYSDEKGFVYLVDLVNKKVNDLNLKDDSAKLEFVWAQDGQKVYFLQGTSSDVVSVINVTDGSIKKLVEDKVNYKSDLRLSVDGKKLLYLVGKDGATVLDESKEVENIDLTGTEQQIYVVNLENAELKAVAVTTTNDNKVFPNFLANGNIVYVSADPESDKLPELKTISPENVVSTLVSNKDIIDLFVTSKGELMILATESNGYSVIYEWNSATKTLKNIAQTKSELTSFSVSNDGKLIVATTPGNDGEKLVLLKNGVMESLTK